MYYPQTIEIWNLKTALFNTIKNMKYRRLISQKMHKACVLRTKKQCWERLKSTIKVERYTMFMYGVTCIIYINWYRFNSIPIKIPAGFFLCVKITKLILKSKWKCRESQVTETTWKKGKLLQNSYYLSYRLIIKLK